MSERKKTVAVDLDGTISQYEEWKGLDHFGDPIKGAREFLAKLSENYEVLIYTTRTCLAINDPEKARQAVEANRLHILENAADFIARKIERWLDKHNLPYDRVYVGQGKPIASAYIDDRAVSCRPQEHCHAYQMALLQTDFLAGKISKAKLQAKMALLFISNLEESAEHGV